MPRFLQFLNRFFVLLLLFHITAVAGENRVLNLEQALNLALQENNQLKSSQFGIQKARWNRLQAWSLLFPAVSFNTRYMWIDDETYRQRDFSRYFDDPNLGFTIPKTVFQNSYNSSIDLSTPLFNGTILNGLRIASAAVTQADKSNQSVRDNLIYEVIASYLNLLRSKALLGLQEEYLNLSAMNLQKAERLHEAGRYSRSEVLRWKVDYQQQKSNMENSKAALRSSEAVLRKNLRLPADESLIPEELLPEKLRSAVDQFSRQEDKSILSMLDIPDEDLTRINTALAAASSGDRINRLLYRNQYTSFLPNISLDYSYGWRENNTLALDEYSPKTVIVNFSIPLFTSGQNLTKVRAAYYEYKQSQALYDDQLQNTRLLLTEAVNRFLNVRSQHELAAAALELAEINYQIIEQQKEQGLVSNLDFIDAKLNMQNSAITKISSEYDLISSVVELFYLTGRMNEIAPDSK